MQPSNLARGEETSGSNIDFLVDLPPGYDVFAQRLALAERLEEITGRHVDRIPRA